MKDKRIKALYVLFTVALAMVGTVLSLGGDDKVALMGSIAIVVASLSGAYGTFAGGQSWSDAVKNKNPQPPTP